jgi:hypothetical protein
MIIKVCLGSVEIFFISNSYVNSCQDKQNEGEIDCKKSLAVNSIQYCSRKVFLFLIFITTINYDLRVLFPLFCMGVKLGR